MTQPVTDGADVDRLDEVASQLSQLSGRTATVAQEGSQGMRVLHDAWYGPDLEQFSSSWSSSRSLLDQVVEQLDTAAAHLRRQADDQRHASDGAGAGHGGAAGPRRPDDNDARDGFFNWFRRIFDREGYEREYDGQDDPGEGNVQLPEGADPDDPAIQELLDTPRGRAVLDWMARNDIAIVVDPNETGAYYDASTNTMTLGGGYVDPSTIIHEASHAEWDATDNQVVATEVSKDEYVDHAIDNETEAVTEEVYYAQERRAQGHDVPVDRAEQDYQAAYDEAIDSGASAEEADQAGRGAIRELFTSGYYETSTTGQSYPEYYGSYWDSVN